MMQFNIQYIIVSYNFILYHKSFGKSLYCINIINSGYNVIFDGLKIV